MDIKDCKIGTKVYNDLLNIQGTIVALGKKTVLVEVEGTGREISMLPHYCKEIKGFSAPMYKVVLTFKDIEKGACEVTFKATKDDKKIDELPDKVVENLKTFIDLF